MEVAHRDNESAAGQLIQTSHFAFLQHFNETIVVNSSAFLMLNTLELTARLPNLHYITFSSSACFSVGWIM